MNSSVRIDYIRGRYGNEPCIKIVSVQDQPADLESESDNDDVRDKLISEFLYTPLNSYPNDVFVIGSSWSIPNGTRAFIVPLKNEDRLLVFRNLLVNTLKNWEIPHDPQFVYSFYDQIDKLVNNSLEAKKQNVGLPKSSKLTISHVFETMLSQDERIAAFQNTPKYKWDSEVNSPDHALDIAFDFASSPEGSEYWNKVLSNLNKQIMQAQNDPTPETKKREEFANLVNPLIDWLNANYDPHTSIIVNCNNAELLRGEMAIANTPVDEFY